MKRVIASVYMHHNVHGSKRKCISSERDKSVVDMKCTNVKVQVGDGCTLQVSSVREDVRRCCDV